MWVWLDVSGWMLFWYDNTNLLRTTDWYLSTARSWCQKLIKRSPKCWIRSAPCSFLACTTTDKSQSFPNKLIQMFQLTLIQKPLNEPLEMSCLSLSYACRNVVSESEFPFVNFLMLEITMPIFLVDFHAPD